MLQVQVIAQIDVIDKGDFVDPAAQFGDLFFQFLFFAFVPQYGILFLQCLQLLFKFAQASSTGCGQRNATTGSLAHGAYHVDLGRIAFVHYPGAHVFERFNALQLALHQIGQFQVFKQKIEELILADLEHKIIDTFAAVAGIAFATATATTATLGALNVVAGNKFLVAGMNHIPLAALAMVEERF